MSSGSTAAIEVLQIDDGGDGRLENHIGHAGDVGLADVVPVVDLDLGVQPVVGEQDGARFCRVAAIADELGGIRQSHQPGRIVEPCFLDALEADGEAAVVHGIALDGGVRAGGQRGDLVEEALGPGEHLGAAHGVVAAAARGAAVLGKRIGAVERIVEAAPAGVGGVEGVACVGHRHNQLGSSDMRDLVVDVGRIDGEIGSLRHEIAGLAEEGLVGIEVERPALALAVPCIDPGLQLIALGEQRAVLGRKVLHDAVEAGPKAGLGHARTGQRFLDDEIVENPRHAQAVDDDALGHAFFVLRLLRRLDYHIFGDQFISLLHQTPGVCSRLAQGFPGRVARTREQRAIAPAWRRARLLRIAGGGIFNRRHYVVRLALRASVQLYRREYRSGRNAEIEPARSASGPVRPKPNTLQ